MKNLKQIVFYLIAMMVLGFVIVFLLFALSNRQAYEQVRAESELPEIKKEQARREETIRVVIKTKGFKKIAHDEVKVKAKNGLIVFYGEKQKKYKGGEVFQIDEASKMFEKGVVTIETQKETDKIEVCSFKRGYGYPTYEGTMELFLSKDGIVIVNEVSLQSYLCAVVPSEMPASYEMEALKAQAVCARCYAYNQMKEMSYPEYGAHIDDSVSFQVYNNSKRNKRTTEAVKETKGELLWYGEQVAMTYFYSTSSGESTSVEAWGTKLIEENQYLKGVSIAKENGTAYETDLAWYRWSAEVPIKKMAQIIEKNTGENIGTLKNIEVTKKGTGGVALELTIWGTEDTLVVEKENKIRRTLGGEGYKITKQDGKVIESMELLPSAFFEIEKNKDSFVINGGGYGHGIGMSQNGANELAKDGKNYQEILQFFYPGTKVEKQ